MATYTTVLNVSTDLVYNFQGPASRKLTEDGWINIAGVFNRNGFIQFFIDRTARFIESYLAGEYTPPFAQSGVLERINRALTVFEIELYCQSAQSDRTVNISIYQLQKDAMHWLQQILDGEVDIASEGEEISIGTFMVIGPCGTPLSECAIEKEVLFND